MKLKTKYNIGDKIYYYRTPTYDIDDLQLRIGKIEKIVFEDNKIYYKTTLGTLEEDKIFTSLKDLTDFVITKILVSFGKLYKMQNSKNIK